MTKEIEMRSLPHQKKFFGRQGLLYVACLLAAPSAMCQQQIGPSQQQQVHQDKNLEFPAGAGKEIVLKTCSKCHSPNVILAAGEDREGWENTITKMVSLGATGTDEDFTAILDYLVKNVPPATAKINVNKITGSQLETQLGLSANEANEVISYREKNGSFKSIDDLKKVPNVDAKKLDLRKDRLVF